TARRGRRRHGDPRRSRAGGGRRARADARARTRRAVPGRPRHGRVRVSAELTMPKLSDSMADAVIIKWLKSPGDGFRRGEALFEVETDKATVVYEAEVDGTLAESLVPEGGTAAVGQPIAELGTNGAAAPPAAATPAAAPPVEERPNATPVARRTATQLGVSLHGLRGSGRPRSRARRRADGDAGDDRAPYGGVGGHDPGVHRLDRRRRVARRGSSEGRRRCAVHQRLRRESSRPHAPRLPALQRVVRRGCRSPALACQRRHRRRHRRRIARARRVRRRRQDTRADLGGDAPARRRGPATHAAPGGAAGRHVHGLEPRDVRRALVHRDRRSAAGGDPRRRRHRPRCDVADHELRPPRRLRRRRRPLPLPATRAARAAARTRALMPPIAFRTAVRDALDEELAADERVIFFGEDVAVAGGVFAATPGLYEKYGPQRVFDTPISELALAGAAFGSAVTGLRPVIEIMFGDFLTLAMDMLVNQATKYRFLTGGQVSVPLVIRSVVGAGGRFGAIHSQMPASWFMGVPGLKIVAPSTPADAKSLLKAAIRDDNPVLFFEHKRL